jgi:hypothetical protein
MGVLSKFKNKQKIIDDNKDLKIDESDDTKGKLDVSTITKKPRKKRRTRKSKDIESSIPEIDNPSTWIREVVNIARKGIRDIPKGFNDLHDENIGRFSFNLGAVFTNYISFRLFLVEKLANYYNDTEKALRDINKHFKGIDKDFIDSIVEVINEWWKNRK